MKILAAIATFIAAFVAVALAASVVVVVFAGPHSDLLPRPLQMLVHALAWIAVLVMPFVAARAVWRRMPDGAA